MGKAFEIVNDIEVAATPEQAWQAVATGEGMDAWFMGENQIEPREGGKVRTITPGFAEEATVTTWDPPNRFVYRSDAAEDGSFMSFDYRIEGGGKGNTAIRWVHSGFLGGDWEAEYEAMNEGDGAYFHKLGQYLTYFFGRKATPVDAVGPKLPDQEQGWRVIRDGLGLPGPVAVDDTVRLTPKGITPIDGTVEWVSPSFLGVRSQDALYRFILAFYGPIMVGHHIFKDVDQNQAVDAWKAWMNGLVA